MDVTPHQDVSGLNVRGLNHVILELHRAGRETACEQFQNAALALVQELIPFDSAWWGNAAAEPMEIHQLYLYNCDDSILEAYTPYMDQDFFRAALIAQPGVSINMSDLITRERFVRSELYREVGKHYRIEWSLGTLLVEPVSQLQEFLTLWRHDGTKPFNTTERQTKELIMSHLAEAHRVSRLRNVLGETREQNKGWAVADKRGYLREASPSFVHCIREHWPDWKGSRLPPPLLNFIVLGTPFNHARLKLKITPKGEFRYLQVLANSALDSLSAREMDIATRYAEGETYSEIANTLALSPSTVRNHIARCFRKLSVNNKAELILRVMQATSHQ